QGRAPDRARQSGDDHRRDLIGHGSGHRSGCQSHEDRLHQHGRQLRRSARRKLQPLHVPYRGGDSMMVRAVGQYLKSENMIQGKKWYSLTADYAFGHDLFRVAKQFVSENGGEFVGEELVPTDATDFSPYLLKIRQARPDVVASNLAGNQITNF